MSNWDRMSEHPTLPSIYIAGTEVHPGDQVRLWPKGSADIFDMGMKGRTATITAIEQDYEDRIHLAVMIDEDPGRDFGQQGKPAHRFFFRPDEVEPLEPMPPPRRGS